MSMRKRVDRKIQITADKAIFVIALLIYSVLMYQLFFRQAAHAFAEDIYMSDMKAYLQTMLGQESGFDFPYPVFFTLGKCFLLFTSVEVAAALATTLLNSLCVIIVYYYMCKWVINKSGRAPLFWLQMLVMVMTFSLFFVSMLYAPQGVYLPGMTHKYLGVFSPNPYHNATYMATRPFSVAVFFLFENLLNSYAEKADFSTMGLFSLYLLATTLTKPSFTLVFVSTAGVVMGIRMVRRIITEKSFKAALPEVRLGLFFLPTFAVLLYQFGGVFGKNSLAGQDGGIGFGFLTAWKSYMENIPLAIVLALAFPGLYLVLHWKELKENTLFRFTWELILMGLLQFAFLYEKGDRFIHLNFSWGYMHGIFFGFLVTLILLIQKTLQGSEKWYKLLPLWLAYGWHVGCGLVYFSYIWSGQFYYCF